MKAIRESGVIPELAQIIREITLVARDTSKEIHKTAKEFKESGVMDDTARAIKETRQHASDTIQDVKYTAKHAFA